MQLIRLLVLCVLVFSAACTSKNKDNSSKSPEAVVREWQRYIDNNQYQNAMTLSTDLTKHWLENVGDAFVGDTVHVETKFLSLSCKESGEIAVCKCQIKQEGTDEIYEDIFNLVKVNGQWLVDINDYDHEGEGEVLENSNLPANTRTSKEEKR